MMSLSQVDIRLLDAFWQPYADYVNDRFGKSNYWLAKIAAMGAFLCWTILWVFEAYAPYPQPFGVFGTLLDICGSFSLLVLSVIFHAFDIHRAKFERTRTMSPFRNMYPWGIQRIMFYILASFVLTLFLCVSLPDHMGQRWPLLMAILLFPVFAAISFAFAGCTTKPRKPVSAKVPASAKYAV